MNIASHIKLRNKSSGVTLLELGMVLIVIGIVISSAYIAYDYFITRAKTTKTMIEMKDYRKGFESFHSVYGALPGDITSASRRINSDMIDGNGDGKIASESEQNAFWPHMSYSKMITKQYGGNYENVTTNVSPKVGVNLPRLQDSDDIAIGVTYNTPSGVRANSFILGGVDGRAVTLPRFSVEEAQIMDQKFDDNNPSSGGIMCGKNTQSGTILVCSYANMSVQSDANIFIPFTPQTSDASNSCPAQSVQISQQLVANVPSIAANTTVQYNCRDINPSYTGTYSIACNQSKDSSNNIVGYTLSTTATSCSLKACAVPALSSISGAASIQSTAVQSGQYLSYTCNSGLYATKSLCSPNLTTDTAAFNPAPACTSAPTGVAGNIPIYAPDAQTIKDSGRSFNDNGSTVYDIFSGNKIFGLFGATASSQNYIPKYSSQNAGVIPSSIYDNGTSVGIGTQTPNANAALEITSTTKAFLPPRMTTAQMGAITSPTAGMVVFNTSDASLYQHNGSAWKNVTTTMTIAGATPVGTIVAWGSATIPNGWLLLNGATYSSTTYPDLATALSCGTATCTLPNFRGYFLRGLDAALSIDKNNASGSSTAGTARTLLSIQQDDVESHSHTITASVATVGYGSSYNSGTEAVAAPSQSTVRNNGTQTNSATFRFTESLAGGIESRPKNIAVNYIIKAQVANLTSTDITNILAQMLSTVTSGSANAIVMFDNNSSKMQSSGLSQVSNILTYNPTGSASLMSVSSTGMLLKPTSGMALQIGNSYTGIGNPNYTGTNGLSDKLQLYVNSISNPSVTINANSQVGIGSGASSPTLPLSLGDNYTGLSSSTTSTTDSSTISFGVKTNSTTSGTTSVMTLSTKGLTLPSNSVAPTLPLSGTVYYNTVTKSLQIYNGTSWSSMVTSAYWNDSTDITNNPSTINNAMSAGDISVNGLVVGKGSGTGTGNSAFGISALKTNSTGANNTAIGNLAGSTLTSGSNNALIGNNAQPETSSQSNTITLGDANITKFRIPGLSLNALLKQIFIGINPSAAVLAGIPAVLIGDVGTGISNSNSTGVSGLTNTLDFYINGVKRMYLDANGTLTIANLAPNTLTVGAGGLTTTTFTATGTSTLAGVSATSIANSGALSVDGTSTLTGLLTANGGITTNNLTVTGTLTAPQVAQPNLVTSGYLSVGGTSTLTGLLTANGGIKFGTTAPATPSVGMVYYDTTTKSLKLYSTDGVNAGWFRFLTRKDIIAFTIGGPQTSGTFDVCSTYTSLTITPQVASVTGGTVGCPNDGYAYIYISIPFPIESPVITATWGALSTVNWTQNNDVTSIFILDITTTATTTTFKVAFGETSSNTQYNKIHVTVVNPN